MRTEASPIWSRPTRWSIATRRTPDQRARIAAPISRIFASAIGLCASYSRNFTGRPSVWLRTTPEKITTPPAPGSSTCAAISSGDKGQLTTAKMSAELFSIISPLASAVEQPAARTTATDGREEAELGVGSETMVRLDVIVADREQCVGTVTRQVGVAGDDRLPRGLDGPALGDVHVQSLLPGGFSIPGEETDAD